MAIALPNQIRAVLLDIEGTTTPIDFVYKTLFPFARERFSNFLAEHQTDKDIQTDLEGLLTEHSTDIARGLNPPTIAGVDDSAGLVGYFTWLMAQDRKATPLKSLQGKIWDEGYRAGKLHSKVFDDVPPAFNRWNARGLLIYIYSSGSVLAQKILFANTEAGDLTRFIQGYFDTNIGAKMSSESYEKIALSIGIPTTEIVFFSDVVTELEAASSAKLQTVLCKRPGNHSQPANLFDSIESFDEV